MAMRTKYYQGGHKGAYHNFYFGVVGKGIYHTSNKSHPPTLKNNFLVGHGLPAVTNLFSLLIVWVGGGGGGGLWGI